MDEDYLKLRHGTHAAKSFVLRSIGEALFISHCSTVNMIRI